MGVARDQKVHTYKVNTDGSRITAYRDDLFGAVRTVNVPDASMQPILMTSSYNNDYTKFHVLYYEAWNGV